MAKTIVGLYDHRTTAAQVAQDLQQAGFGKDHVQFSSSEKGDRHDFEVKADTFRSAESLTRYGIADEEAKFFAEGLRRGGALVVVRTHDKDADTAADIMARHNPVDYNTRSKAYGASGYDASAAAYSDDEARAERDRYAGEQTQRLQEIEENLKVGKREVVRGGVRVHQHVESKEVQEQIRLREETVHVDRTAVDRELTPDEADSAFEDKTIELVERDEEAVVSKSARVTGEVAVGKDVDVRTETVGGTVRKTSVEVEDTTRAAGTKDARPTR